MRLHAQWRLAQKFWCNAAKQNQRIALFVCMLCARNRLWQLCVEAQQLPILHK
jgi:hypothetical protein